MIGTKEAFGAEGTNYATSEVWQGQLPVSVRTDNFADWVIMPIGAASSHAALASRY